MTKIVLPKLRKESDIWNDAISQAIDELASYENLDTEIAETILRKMQNPYK